MEGVLSPATSIKHLSSMPLLHLIFGEGSLDRPHTHALPTLLNAEDFYLEGPFSRSGQAGA